MHAPVPLPPAVRTACPYCGVGCGVLARPDGRGGAITTGDPDHPANSGRLCSKGFALEEQTVVRAYSDHEQQANQVTNGELSVSDRKSRARDDDRRRDRQQDIERAPGRAQRAEQQQRDGDRAQQRKQHRLLAVAPIQRVGFLLEVEQMYTLERAHCVSQLLVFVHTPQRQQRKPAPTSVQALRMRS